VLFKGVEAHVTLRAARRAGGVFKRPSNPLEGHIFSGKSSSNHVRFYFIGTFPAFFFEISFQICVFWFYTGFWGMEGGS
jgi:hypothetical protein